MKKRLFVFALLGAVVLCGSGCNYFMLWKISSHEHDETAADREMRSLEEARALRMQNDANYTDQQINAVNARSSIGTRRSTTSRPLSIEELREQQERERAARKKR